MDTMYNMTGHTTFKRERVAPAPEGEKYEKYKKSREAFPNCKKTKAALEEMVFLG